MITDLQPAGVFDTPTPNQHVTPRSPKMSLESQLRMVHEMQRERLRSTERWRVQRAALRARRVLAQQLMR
jgi:hypothetical protein